MGLHEILRRTESVTAVDRPAGALARTIGTILPGKVAELLRGSWLGHPVHPLLVTVPIGAWTSAAVFDGLGRRRAARQLIGLGLAAVPAAVLAGAADYPGLTTVQRRTGVVHAATNSVATAFLLASYLCRVRGSHRAGIALSAVGLTALSVGGALGGHLAYAQGGGVYRYQAPPFVRHSEPVAARG
jgi:uncharacterized membrane protein